MAAVLTVPNPFTFAKPIKGKGTAHTYLLFLRGQADYAYGALLPTNCFPREHDLGSLEACGVDLGSLGPVASKFQVVRPGSGCGLWGRGRGEGYGNL